jgi:hypothetical protein
LTHMAFFASSFLLDFGNKTVEPSEGCWQHSPTLYSRNAFGKDFLTIANDEYQIDQHRNVNNWQSCSELVTRSYLHK